MGYRHEEGLHLEDEGDINAYLGINITRPTPKTFKMNQPALIKSNYRFFIELKDQRST